MESIRVTKATKREVSTPTFTIVVAKDTSCPAVSVVAGPGNGNPLYL